MGQVTKIEWCHHTFNPWRGCTRVSPGCLHCYAETLSHRNPGTLGVWGPNGTRVVAAESQWREPLRWDRRARDGVCWHCRGRAVRPTTGRCEACDGSGRVGPYRARVFCASLADVFEDWRGSVVDPRGRFLQLTTSSCDPMYEAEREGVAGYGRASLDVIRQRLFRLIRGTPCLDWLLLTKRPQNVNPIVAHVARYIWRDGIPPNVWLGVSVEDQAHADARIPHLLTVPAAVRFLSCEPLLGPLDLTRWLATGLVRWVIVGGESGPGYRACDPAWLTGVVEDCNAAGVACFVKQDSGPSPGRQGRLFEHIWSVKEYPDAL